MSRIQKPSPRAIVYPDRDGKRMSDNTLQYLWIVTIEGNLEILFADRPDVFVAGDLLWYPVEGKPKIRTAPDVLVAFGRPKGHRGSYKQWEEGGVAPQVVFEILSPGNRAGEMQRKFDFYNRRGVQEYYVYDPDKDVLRTYLRDDRGLVEVDIAKAWTSPLLGIAFDRTTKPMSLRFPDGRPFRNFRERGQDQEQIERERDAAARQRDTAERERDAAARERDEAARERDQERARANQLAAKLRELGIDPD
jgi:Uma2 family endonuclease